MLSGEIDLLSQARLRSCLAEALTARPSEIIVDMTDLTFIDSSGLTALITAHRQLDATSGHLALANVPQVAMRVLEITGLHNVFTILSQAGTA